MVLNHTVVHPSSSLARLNDSVANQSPKQGQDPDQQQLVPPRSRFDESTPYHQETDEGLVAGNCSYYRKNNDCFVRQLTISYAIL
jgi:hypothetical protein